MEAYRLIVYFFIYGFTGWCVEVAFASVKERRFVNRGFLNGPIFPVYGVGVGAVVTLLEPWKDHLVLLYVASVILVTFIEWLTGYAMDKIFHHKWWDYSEMPLNIGGYVCLLFSLVWGAACVVIMKIVHPMTEKLTELVPFPLGLTLCVLFIIVLAVDIAVTSAGILKLNKRLEAMEKIAMELHEISDKMGINIHENVMDAVEKLERLEDRKEEFLEKYGEFSDLKEDLKEDIRGDMRMRREELKKRYEELAAASTHVSRRLAKAFPKMESRKHREILNELRERMEKRKTL